MWRRCRTCRASRPRPDVKVLQTNELRTIFFAFNMRDALTESDVKGKNPFKDKQVREALYRAIDIDALQRRAMRGLSRNTGALVAPAIPGYAPEQDKRLPFDRRQARRSCSPPPAIRTASRSISTA